MHLEGHTFHLRRGALVLIPPTVKYTVEGDKDFAYMYVTFTGERAFRLVEPCGPEMGGPVFYGFEWLIEFWQNCIRRISTRNADLSLRKIADIFPTPKNISPTFLKRIRVSTLTCISLRCA